MQDPQYEIDTGTLVWRSIAHIALLRTYNSAKLNGWGLRGKRDYNSLRLSQQFTIRKANETVVFTLQRNRTHVKRQMGLKKAGDYPGKR